LRAEVVLYFHENSTKSPHNVTDYGDTHEKTKRLNEQTSQKALQGIVSVKMFLIIK
jgi:hypothetical protein